MIRFYLIGAALLATIAAPFLLRPKGATSPDDADYRVVIITPHNESIRYEFGVAFSRHLKATTGKTVHVDWRTPGVGTAEIERYVDSAYFSGFRQYWTQSLGRRWEDAAVGGAFNNGKIELPEDPVSDTLSESARRAFLNSNVGIGIDLFFGGGAYPFDKFARKGYLIDSGVARRHPEWFTDESIPARAGGEPFYDPQMRWVGTCLSSFGICHNTHALRRLGITDPPTQWEDLGHPAYFGQIALADPGKSGSVTKAFEMLIQQEMHRAVNAFEPRPDLSPAEERELAVREGWKAGINLIQRICANARYFTDSATKIPLDVAAGNATAGMCIDFYGRTYNEMLRKADGRSRVEYTTPVGGSSWGADPIALFRGAPNPEMAAAFIDFVLSEQGQRLWNFRVGVEYGPVRTALRRPSLRKDFYSAENMERSADPDVRPFEVVDQFEYVPEWTEKAFRSISFIIRISCLDSHEELREAWQALIEADFPPLATRIFEDTAFVSHQAATGAIAAALASPDRMREVILARQLGDAFRSNYRRAAELAREGK